MQGNENDQGSSFGMLQGRVSRLIWERGIGVWNAKFDKHLGYNSAQSTNTSGGGGVNKGNLKNEE